MEPQISFNLKSVPVGLAMYFGETGCQNSWQAQRLAHSSLAPPLRMLQGRQMNGAHPPRLYNDVSEEVAGWAHQIDIRSDLERERF